MNSKAVTMQGGGRHRSAISLLEVLLVVAAFGTLAATATSGYGHLVNAISADKLKQDVSSLNRLVHIYEASGGDLAGVTDPQEVLDKLKTVRAAASDDTYVGFGGSIVDSRLVALPQSTEEAASDQKRAIWNAGGQKFEIATSGAGITGFAFSDEAGAADHGTENRDEGLLAFNNSNGWVWDYDNAVPAPTALAPTTIALGETVTTPTTGTPPPPPTVWPPIGPAALYPPTLSSPGGAYLPSEFPLTLTIDNSANPSTSTWVMYAINGGAFQIYSGPLSLNSGDTVDAYVEGDADLWSPSGHRSGVYTALAPSDLDAPAIFTSVTDFAWTVAETAAVTITNPNDPAESSVEYRLQGGSWTPFAGAFDLSINDYPSGVTIEARAVPTTIDYSVSTTAGSTIGVPSSCVARTTGIDPGSWAVGGATAIYTFADGTSIVLTGVGTSWSIRTVNNWVAWSQPIDGTSDVEATFDPNDSFTVEVFDAANQPISPESIELHFDRLGGSSGAGVFTLQGGLTWSSIAGNEGFVKTSATVQTGLGGTNQSGGSVELDQSTSSLTIINEGVQDRIGIQVTVCR